MAGAALRIQRVKSKETHKIQVHRPILEVIGDVPLYHEPSNFTASTRRPFERQEGYAPHDALDDETQKGPRNCDVLFVVAGCTLCPLTDIRNLGVGEKDPITKMRLERHGSWK